MFMETQLHLLFKHYLKAFFHIIAFLRHTAFVSDFDTS